MMGDAYKTGKGLQIWLGEADEVANHTGADSIRFGLASKKDLDELAVFLHFQSRLTKPPFLHIADGATESGFKRSWRFRDSVTLSSR